MCVSLNKYFCNFFIKLILVEVFAFKYFKREPFCYLGELDQ